MISVTYDIKYPVFTVQHLCTKKSFSKYAKKKKKLKINIKTDLCRLLHIRKYFQQRLSFIIVTFF